MSSSTFFQHLQVCQVGGVVCQNSASKFGRRQRMSAFKCTACGFSIVFQRSMHVLAMPCCVGSSGKVVLSMIEDTSRSQNVLQKEMNHTTSPEPDFIPFFRGWRPFSMTSRPLEPSSPTSPHVAAPVRLAGRPPSPSPRATRPRKRWREFREA